ncbi:hypothetical protein PTSG_11723 [Salpingoeca rosetta]|uniref:C2 domain-containing protein n=1 Tax=Salpingoeca rosetta (strain ATCC 50818 / BSB-021) TaxID=946362 RepID=F2U085_SALR5|nr:uncharacterized protein PTSG_11723 [Salpingoeca rosetta]EGD80813.1 hypothetical protein PTSG_11723 [Salpingoeca rosetta]|eukprot:XP_004997374.1 hypothetical protein PTSG_11723 [Salpingoeca rosetta]
MGLIRLPAFRLTKLTRAQRHSQNEDPVQQAEQTAAARKESVFEDVGQAAKAADDVQTSFDGAQQAATTQTSVVQGNITDEVSEHQQAGFQNAGMPVHLTTAAQAAVSEDDNAAAYKSVLSLIEDRIGGFREKGLAPQPLTDYARAAFHVTQEQHDAFRLQVPKHEKTCIPVLHVMVERATNLLDKDVSGKSDPYVILRLFSSSENIKHKLHDKHAEQHQAHKSSIIRNDLNPVWNEEFTFDVDTPDSALLVVDVWDSDSDEHFSLSKASHFKLTEFKPCQFVKDKVQALHHKEKDDFLGHAELPVSAVPVEGTPIQLRLQPRSSRSSVRGTIELKLWWTTKALKPEDRAVTPAVIVEQHRALLHRLVDYEAAPFNGDRSRAWPGTFSTQARHLLRQHALRHAITPFQELVARFRVFSEYNVRERMNLVPLQRLLKDINDRWDDTTRETHLNPSEQEALALAIDHTVQACLEIIGRLFLDFKQDEAGQIAFATTILTLKTCFAAPLWRLAPDNTERVLINEVDATIRNHLRTFYDHVLSEAANSEKDFYGSDIVRQVVAIKRLITTMAAARQLFRPALLPLDYDLFVVTVDVLDDPLAKSCQDILTAWNASHSTEEAMAGKFSIVFELYFALRKLIKSEYRHLPEDQLCKMEMPKVHDWFFPVLIKWLQLVASNSPTWIQRALEYDELQPITSDVQFSSSVVDVFRVLNDLRDVWTNLNFPPTSDFYGPLVKLLADTLSEIALNYVRSLLELTRDKFQTSSRDGTFELSDTICVVLNNAQEVSFKLEDFAEGMKKDAQQASDVWEHVDAILQSRLADCHVFLSRVCTAVARCLRPEILRTMAIAVFESDLGHDASKGEQVTTSDMEEAASELLDFVNNSLITLVNGIYQETFQVFLLSLWNVVCECIVDILVPTDAMLGTQRLDDLSATQKALLVVLLQTLEDFFWQDGAGLTKDQLRTTEWELATDLLEKVAWDTSDLIAVFFKEEAKIQQRASFEDEYHRGVATFTAQLDPTKNELHVTVAHLENLPVMDSNGKCDPYVELDVHPEMTPGKQRTSTKYKTRDAEFNESFTFSTDAESTEDFVLHLVAMDHDLLSRNDYIGECLLSLEELQDAQPHQLRRSLRRAPARDKAWQVLRLIERRKRRDKTASHFAHSRSHLSSSH